jgi:hypothetical protein
VAKQGGLSDNFYVAEFDLSGDVGSISNVSGGPAALDVTPVNKSGHERLGGVRTGMMEWSTFFNDATGQAHDALSSLLRTDRVVSYFRGTTLGNPAASQVAKQVTYDPQRANDGGLVFGVQALANGYGVQWGRQATAGVRTDTGATNGSPIDDGAGSSFGLQAFLHVFAFTGTDATVKLQESSDNSGDTYADVTGGGFTQVTGVTSERIATADDLAVERYLRVITTTSGGFSDMDFAVVVVRNTTATSF